MSVTLAFAQVRSALARAGIRYAIGGFWASTAFGEPRFTNDIDILAEFSDSSLRSFLDDLPSETFYLDADESVAAVAFGRSFNVIYLPTILKFDFFPAAAFALGKQELDRAITFTQSGLSDEPVPFVTPEDILLAKLYWFRLGGEVSQVQWRDIMGIVDGRKATLDRTYLEDNATRLKVADLLHQALAP